jgi:Ca2+-binding RTX toxin-like protein
LAGANDFDPSWSPDGTKLAFLRQTFDAMMHIHSSIQIAAADGSGTASLVTGTDDNDEGEPAWSPDGTRLAVTHFSGTLNGIEVIGVDGSNPIPIDTPDSRSDESPAWSPDGSTIWFSQGLLAAGCFSQSQIWAAPASGTGRPVLMSKDPSFSDYGPAPSPDGTKVAFVRCDDSTDGIHHIYTMNTDGTGAVPVTSGTNVDDYAPDWQPSAPVFATPPSINGADVNNQTLTATAGSSPGGGSTALQFLRCDSHGANCVAIPGASAARAHAAASSATYKLQSVDLGRTIKVRQTQTNSLGSSTLDSSPTGSVVPSKGHCSNRFAGTARADRIKGSSGSDRLIGGRGKDQLSGLAGADCISGGAGNDVISGGKGNDTLSGGAGNDRITAGPGRNKVNGGAGNDRINVRNHKRDVVNCGKGKKDRVIADKHDKLRGCEIVKRSRR